ncbi:MAG: hypothetical protein KDD89_07485, partial [Anaerolineales bacterium]|nr:hypothetical protein [Anaerolineales bacterium]
FIHIRNAANDTLKYEGAIITSAGNMGNVFVSTRFGRCTDNEADVLAVRCFEITPDVPQSADIRFFVGASEMNGINVGSFLGGQAIAWHYDGPPGIWSGASSTATYTSGVGGSGTYYVEAAAVTAYSPFAVGLNANTPTAVTLNTIQTNQTNSFWFMALVGLLFVLLITLIKLKFIPVQAPK